MSPKLRTSHIEMSSEAQTAYASKGYPIGDESVYSNTVGLSALRPVVDVVARTTKRRKWTLYNNKELP